MQRLVAKIHTLISISVCLSLPNVGARLRLVLSRGGAADIAVTQSWVTPGTAKEVGLTKLSFGYAVTRNLRLSTDIQKQNSRHSKDSRMGIVLEWMP